VGGDVPVDNKAPVATFVNFKIPFAGSVFRRCS
jgi:hypothetical protein